MQLVAYGAQDIYLTGNPQITFFKVVYRRHTNFSMEAIEQTWNGSNNASGRCTATISRNGDLVHRMYLEVSGTVNAATDNLSSMITDVELEIGGQKIDKQSGKWMEVWAELTEPNTSGLVAVQASPQIEGTPFQRMSGMGGLHNDAAGAAVVNSFIPLQFWFCRNPGLALPLIALQYHEVKVILNHLISATLDANHSNKLWADYIYLDTDERRRFAQVSHEYLIEQVQEQSLAVAQTNDLNFNHPVKELIWACSTAVAGRTTTSLLLPFDAIGNTAHIKLNGHDRFSARDSRYFTRTQVWQHHTGGGGLNVAGGQGIGKSNDSIAVYSFALKPEEHQPSGTCNFSRIDNAQLITNANVPAETHIYAVNYNVLRIMSGMGGLAYSN